MANIWYGKIQKTTKPITIKRNGEEFNLKYMTFATGFILGSMMSGGEHSLHASNVVEPQDTLVGLIGFFVVCVATIVLIYFFLYRDKRKELKDAINNLVYYNLTTLLIYEYQGKNLRRDRIQRRIEVLEEEPAFFGSPLYIARLQLRTEIKSKLEELKIELENLEKQN